MKMVYLLLTAMGGEISGKTWGTWREGAWMVRLLASQASHAPTFASQDAGPAPVWARLGFDVRIMMQMAGLPRARLCSSGEARFASSGPLPEVLGLFPTFGSRCSTEPGRHSAQSFAADNLNSLLLSHPRSDFVGDNVQHSVSAKTMIASASN
jgi:hypothetical protein